MQIGKTYTFNTVAPAILGAIVKNAKLISILDYTTALALDNIDIKYKSIFPLLPSGTPPDPASSIFYRFISESGEKIILADVWISESTIVVVDFINIQVNIMNAALTDITVIKDALNALGYTFNIKQI